MKERTVVEAVQVEIGKLLLDNISATMLTGSLEKEIEELSERVVQMVAAGCVDVIEAAENAIDYLLHGKAKSNEEMLLTDELRSLTAMKVLEEALSKFGSRKERKARSLSSELNKMLQKDYEMFSKTKYFS